MKTIGILGLGLIGGSLAKAYQAAGNNKEQFTVYGYDTDKFISGLAALADDIQGILTPDNLADCDIVLLAVHPTSAIEYLRQNADRFSKTGIVIDCCGVKENICREGFALAEKHGFTFLGGHPMAGTHHSGYKAARADLFKGAPMVLVPPTFDDISLLQRAKELLLPVGFNRFTVMTAEEHDQRIAYTSQLAHVVSNAYVKSPTATVHQGCSAGSYRDMTRVAKLSPDLWTELFLEDREPLLHELRFLISSLSAYEKALEERDRDALYALLQEGNQRKLSIDGEEAES